MIKLAISKRSKSLIAILTLYVLYRLYGVMLEERHAPSILVKNEPEQTTPSQAWPEIRSGNVLLPLADYKIEARVLSTERYYFDKESELSPLDLAVGWGIMSDTDVIRKLSISQGGRFYYWSTSSEMPVYSGEIAIHSANMHLIPDDKQIKDQIESIKVGQIVTLYGQLVQATDKTGAQWTSSLSRTDTGDGACELMLVKALTIR